jgi:hypothetical protein
MDAAPVAEAARFGNPRRMILDVEAGGFEHGL